MTINSLSSNRERRGLGKAELSSRLRQDVADYLACGGAITVCESRKERRRYVNPCELSPVSRSQINVTRRNRAYCIPYLFPSSTFGSAGSK